MNCQQDGFCFYPGICCRPPRSGRPVQSPRIYIPCRCGPHCVLRSQGPGLHLRREPVRCVQGGSTVLRGEFGGSPHTSSVGGESTARDTDLSECPLTSGVDLSPHNVLKSPRQQ